ncbi:MAG: multicopper oxidase domain-containing protein, partial [Rhodospirillales bacterium]|nr:multicopper oxidase domain-containing protein [Rhodospirillales bacterium]
MTMMLTRRGLLVSASLAAAAAVAPAGAGAAGSAPLRLTAERRTLDIAGKPASVFGLRQPDGTPGVVLSPGQRFRVDLANRTDVPTIIHWHGQTPPVRQDGVTNTGLESLIPPDGGQGYDFAPRAGTHWMHSHHGLQEQSLMAAPLVVRTAEDQRADAQDVIVLLQDFTFRDPRAVLARLTNGADTDAATGGGPHHGMTMTHGAM